MIAWGFLISAERLAEAEARECGARRRASGRGRSRHRSRRHERCAGFGERCLPGGGQLFAVGKDQRLRLEWSGPHADRGGLTWSLHHHGTCPRQRKITFSINRGCTSATLERPPQSTWSAPVSPSLTRTVGNSRAWQDLLGRTFTGPSRSQPRLWRSTRIENPLMLPPLIRATAANPERPRSEERGVHHGAGGGGDGRDHRHGRALDRIGTLYQAKAEAQRAADAAALTAARMISISGMTGDPTNGNADATLGCRSAAERPASLPLRPRSSWPRQHRTLSMPHPPAP